MLTAQEQEKLAQAAARLARNEDFKFLLTTVKNECIQELTTTDATPDKLVEAHRRYNLADELLHRIETYGRKAQNRT